MSNDRFINPKGFPEFLPEKQLAFESLKQKIIEGYKLYGFEYIETPAIEYLDTLASDGEIGKEIYAITRAKSEDEDSKSGSDRGLRFDLTTPFARYVAQHQGHLTFPFKRYQVDRVWRGERPQKGRYRELYQADVDIVNKDNLDSGYDGEVLSMIASTLDSLGLFDFTIRVNNREFLQSKLLELGVPQDYLKNAFNIVDKSSKLPVSKLLELLQTDCRVSESVATSILDFITQKHSLSDYKQVDPVFQDLYDQTSILSLNRGKIIIDFSIVRGLDYYTGFVYETTVDGYESLGSISSGGRYENLAGKFSKSKFPGVGGSIGLSRLFYALEEMELQAKLITNSGVLILNNDENKQAQYLETVITLRNSKIRTEIYPKVADFSRQFNYAQSKNYKFALIVESGDLYTLKNLSTRDQDKNISINEVIQKIESE
jgi:histidyl-tRNA synthetase